MRQPARYAVVCALVALMLCGCSDDEPLTQVVLVVDSDWDGFARVEIELEDFAEDAVIDVEPRRGRPLLPRRVALVHEGGDLGPFSVTVRGFVAGDPEPVRVEPRSGLFFERGKTLMLKIDLHFECIGECAGQACLAGVVCVDSDDERARALEPWRGDVDAIDVEHRGKKLDAGRTDGSVTMSDAGVDGGDGRDSSVLDSGDADTPSPVNEFPYAPSNFDPEHPALADAPRVDVVLDCGTTRFDSTELAFTDFCGDRAEPTAVVVEQSDGSEAVVLAMQTLDIASSASLELTGGRPVILAVFGDVRIDGAIDASAHGIASGAGGGRACTAGRGGDGDEADWGEAAQAAGASGGGGGGFGRAGARGGPGGVAEVSSAEPTAAGAGGAAAASTQLVPLRAGCAGGDGGAGIGAGGIGGGGGGALQISAAGVLHVTGTISAGGGGGTAGASALSGGGGGGSGGAVALEAAHVQVAATAAISANGGGGGAGQSAEPADAAASAGADGRSGVSAASGGEPEASAGRGGDGGAANRDAEPGDPGGAGSTYGYGGGGGGGAGGQLLVRGAGCALRGSFSPSAAVDCTDCSDCSLGTSPPASGCESFVHDARTYYLCGDELEWAEANASCAAVGLRLVRIDDAAENDVVGSRVDADTWIGASDENEGDWRWTDGTGFWSGEIDGTAVGGLYNAWADDQPDDAVGIVTNADCAIIGSDGEWTDRVCSIARPYVCEQ